MPDKVKIYRDSANEWRWRRKSENGEVVADSGEGYINWEHCNEMAQAVNGSECEYESVQDG